MITILIGQIAFSGPREPTFPYIGNIILKLNEMTSIIQLCDVRVKQVRTYLSSDLF